MTTITCPNCLKQMPVGHGGQCPECDHENDGACTCDHCLMCEEESEDDE